MGHYEFNTLRPRQNGRHFADDIFKYIFLNGNFWIPVKISLKFVPKGTINIIPALVQIMAWRRPGDKPLSEPMVVSLPTHIYASLGLNELMGVMAHPTLTEQDHKMSFRSKDHKHGNNSQYLNQCRILFSEVLWHLIKSNFTTRPSYFSVWVWKSYFKITTTSPRSQRVMKYTKIWIFPMNMLIYIIIWPHLSWKQCRTQSIDPSIIICLKCYIYEQSRMLHLWAETQKGYLISIGFIELTHWPLGDVAVFLNKRFSITVVGDI